MDDDDDPGPAGSGTGGGAGGGVRSRNNYYDKLSLGRASVASNRSAGVRSRFSGGGSQTGALWGLGIVSVGASTTMTANCAGGGVGAGVGGMEGQEQMRHGCKYKIATMQS